MTDIQSFNGFPESGIQFLRDLSENNAKDWFDAHKKTYQQSVQQPAQALVESLGQQLQSEFPPVSYDTRLNGGSLMRIYRDTRFSADKTPYKTNIAMMFTPDGYKRMESPGFGLQITTEQVELIAGSFSFSKLHLEKYRQAVDEKKTGEQLIQAVNQVQESGEYVVNGKELKRVPRDYDKDHPRTEWLKYKGLYIFSPAIPLETAFSDALVEAAMAHFRNMAPVWQWLINILEIK